MADPFGGSSEAQQVGGHRAYLILRQTRGREVATRLGDSGHHRAGLHLTGRCDPADQVFLVVLEPPGSELAPLPEQREVGAERPGRRRALDRMANDADVAMEDLTPLGDQIL